MDSSEIYQAPATATLEQEKATEKHALYVVSPTKFRFDPLTADRTWCRRA